MNMMGGVTTGEDDTSTRKYNIVKSTDTPKNAQKCSTQVDVLHVLSTVLLSVTV